MEKPQRILGRALISGTIAGIATTLAASLAGKREEGSYAAPLNATSHIIWGDKAARKDNVSVKYTGTGYLLNHASAIFWALFYELWFGRRSMLGRTNRGDAGKLEPLIEPILGAAVITAEAYLIDYYLIPKRFTPGFEKRLSGKSLAAIFGVLAVGLAARDLITVAKRNRIAR